MSVRAPLMAVFFVPELAGDLRLLPLTGLAVVAAWALDCGVCRRLEQRAVRVPGTLATVHDEDA